MAVTPEFAQISSFGGSQCDGKRFLNPIPTRVGGASLFFKVLPLYLQRREGKQPGSEVQLSATDPTIYLNPSPSGLRITWFGHSSVLIEIEGFRVMIDPVWDERASPFQRFGPKRFFPPTISLRDLPPIDLVLISHDHYDHLGEQTIRQLSRLSICGEAEWICPLGVGKQLARWGVSVTRTHELDWGCSWRKSLGGVPLTVTGLPTRHFSGRGLGNRFETLWSSFVVESLNRSVYFGADSGAWPGFREIGEKFPNLDLVMLEVGAFHELWRDIHLGPEGAMQAYSQMGSPGMLMPIHWGLFDLALHPWQEPIARLTALADQGGVGIWSPTPGVPTDVLPGVPERSDWWRNH